jgi:ribosomal protein S18 acetylase RimI-like enzyme
MEYREAGLSDIPALIDLRMEFLAEGFPDMTDSENQVIRCNLPEYFQKHLPTDLSIFAAFEAGELVSTVFLQALDKPANPNYLTGKTGVILNVYTRPKFRRRGIAQHLMQAALAKAKDIDLTVVELHAMADGIPLYEKLGFVSKNSPYLSMVFHP